jgi:hypothetical protein
VRLKVLSDIIKIPLFLHCVIGRARSFRIISHAVITFFDFDHILCI